MLKILLYNFILLFILGCSSIEKNEIEWFASCNGSDYYNVYDYQVKGDFVAISNIDGSIDIKRIYKCKFMGKNK